MNAAHTPGPWLVHSDALNQQERWVENEQGWNIAVLSPYLDASPANARLIAAAPELLEAARFDHVLQTEGYTLKAATMLGLADEYGMHGGSWLATRAREKRAAAIQKATGQ